VLRECGGGRRGDGLAVALVAGEVVAVGVGDDAVGASPPAVELELRAAEFQVVVPLQHVKNSRRAAAQRWTLPGS
jgi:hypothetical protein